MRAMTGGIDTTFDILTRTANEAANRVLIPALDYGMAPIRDRAFQTILRRRSAAGHREIIQRLHTLPSEWQDDVLKNHARMVPALRDAILGDDVHLCGNACLATAWFREYELIPSLLRTLDRTEAPDPDVAGRTLMYLAGALCEDLTADASESAWSRDPELVRRQVVASLELSIHRYHAHRRREVLEAYARLARNDSPVLVDLLHRPLDPAFPVLMEIFSRSEQPEVIRLVLSCLDLPQAPVGILKVVARRTDLPFLHALSEKAGVQSTGLLLRNLKRLDLTAWSGGQVRALAAMDELCQQTAVAVLMDSATPRDRVFDVLSHLVASGKVAGRCAAVQALEEFRGVRANELVQAVLEDPDHRVVAKALPQLRRRGIPGALNRLIAMLDHPHAAVRKAARENLGEFTFPQYVAQFEMLDEATRRGNGALVKKVDPQTLLRLREEMKSPLRSRRLRAVSVAQSLDLTFETEYDLIELLQDEDHLVRTEAAALLSVCQSAASAAALRTALSDQSGTVREAARKSLYERGEMPEAFSTRSGGGGLP
jgi:HEAT repeat protein